MFKSTRSILWAALIAITWQFAPLAHAEHGEGLVGVGPAIAPHGFPAWYEDGNGLQLEPCLPPPAGNSANPEMCIFDALGGPPLEVGGETFYWLLGSSLDGWYQGGAAACDGRECNANLTMALEATFVAGEPVNREQMVFVRLRIRIDTPIAGTYTVDYPFGQQVFEVSEAEILDGIGYVADIGGSNFLDPEQGYLGALGVGWQVGPFLVATDFDPTLAANPYARQRVADGVLEQYIADPGQLTTVTGGTHENLFRITAPDGSVAVTDLFSLMGKLFENRDYIAHDFGPDREPVLRAVGPVNRDAPVGEPSDLRPGGLRTGVEYDYPLGYPVWYADNASPYFADWGTEGLRLTLCIPGEAGGLLDPFCISDPIDPADEAQVRMRTGGEGFWWSGDASFPMNADNDALLVLGLESTFGGDESIVDGGQIVFGRLRIRVDVFEDGDYRITHPYGVHLEPGITNDPRDGRGEINFTRDLGLNDPLNPDQAMIGALFSDIGPQVLISQRLAGLRDGTLVPGDLEWPTDLQRPHPFKPGVTEYFVGNLNVPEPVIGSPYDTNVFRVERKPIGAADTEYVTVGETTLFAITGKLFDCETFQFTADERSPCDQNQAPLASDDSYSTPYETTLNVALPGVLANDSDPENDALTAVLESDAGLAGSLALNADGSFDFTPNDGFFGQTSFTYRASDGELTSNVATVTITVNEPQQQNEAPVAVDDSYETDYQTTLDVPAGEGVLANDTDDGLPSGTLTAVLASDAGLAGSLSLGADGSFSFMPDSGFSGSTSFTYRADDGELQSDPATVTITVGVAPVMPIAFDDSATAIGRSPVIIDILDNDTYDGGAIPAGATVAIASQPETGAVVVNGDNTVTYTANTRIDGAYPDDSFTYTVTVNGQASNEATVSITAEQPVPAAAGDSGTAIGRTPVTITVLGNDTYDGGAIPAGATVAVAIVDQPATGAVVINSTNTVTYTADTRTDGAYPNDSFTYTVTVNGEVSNEATVSITAQQPVPVAVTDTGTTSGTTAVNLNILANDYYDLTLDLNTIPAGATVTLFGNNGTTGSQVTTTHGSATLQGNTVTYQAAVATTDPRIDAFNYTVTVNGQVSGTAGVTVTINPATAPPDAPQAVNDSASTGFNTAVNINVLANDIFTGPGGQVLVTVVPGSASGGTATVNNNRTIRFTPTNGFSGQATFRYTITAQGVLSNEATVTVDVAGPPEVDPVANNDSASTTNGNTVIINVLANDTYAGGPIPDGATVAIVTGPSNGTAELNGNNVNYTRAGGFEGQDTFTYTVTFEGRTSNVATVTVTVVAVAELEVITVQNIDVVLRPNGRRTITVSGTTSDLVGNSMTVEILNAAGQYVTLGSSAVNSTTGAWSVRGNNIQIVPAEPNTVRVTSAKGTVLIFGGGS